MGFVIIVSQSAQETLDELESEDPTRHNQTERALAHLETNPNHPGLRSQRYETLDNAHGEKIWESHVENQTPGTWRVWWFYGPQRGEITVVAIGPHP